MLRAEYPEKSCREAVFNDIGMGYCCELVLAHPGPCANFSVKQSVDVRDAWERVHEDWRKDIGNLDDEV